MSEFVAILENNRDLRGGAAACHSHGFALLSENAIVLLRAAFSSLVATP